MSQYSMNILWLGSLTFTMKKLAIQHGCHLRQPYLIKTHFWRFGNFCTITFEILIEIKSCTIGWLPVKILIWLKSRFYIKYAPKVGDNRWFLLKMLLFIKLLFKRLSLTCWLKIWSQISISTNHGRATGLWLVKIARVYFA